MTPRDEADIVFGLLPLSEAPSRPEGAWLDAAEGARLAAMSGPIRPREFLGGRFLLRSMAGRMLGVEPRSIRIEVEQGGKPLVASPRGLFVGLTHTREYAACAVSRREELGLDLEELGRKGLLSGIEDYAFSPDESAALAGLDGFERERAFFAVWTLKEAYLKRLGLGVEAVKRAPSFKLGPAAMLSASGGEDCGYLCFALGDSLIGALAFDPLPRGRHGGKGASSRPLIAFDPSFAPGPGLPPRTLYGDAELMLTFDQ